MTAEAAPERHGYYFETGENLSVEELNERLSRADMGHNPEETRRTTVVYDGVLVSESIVKDAWEYKTGYRHCDGSCRQKGLSHVPWDELSKQQKHTFGDIMAGFMDGQNSERFVVEDEIMEQEDEDQPTFGGIALTRD